MTPRGSSRGARPFRVGTSLALLVLLPAASACLAERAAPAAPAWVTLLAPTPVRRLRAAVLVDARDCAASLGVVELFARPELAGGVGAVTVLVRDGRDSLARYADALLTAPLQLAVVPVPRPLRAAARALGPGPRLALVDPRGQLVWAGRIPDTPDGAASLARTMERVADHYVATELAIARTTP